MIARGDDSAAPDFYSGDLVAGYTYDGLGRMTSETDGITTIDFYYSGEQIIEERTGVTNATGGSTGSNGSVTEELVYSPDYVNDVLSRDTYVSGSYSSRVYFTHDANYDVTGVVQNSTTGTMLQRMTYDAYGNVTFLTSSWATTTDSYAVENLWQGGWRDVNTGYYHFQERWYSPSMQWLSWDPINYPDGPSAYLPEEDNPIRYTDPAGLDTYEAAYMPGPDYSRTIHWLEDWQKVGPVVPGDTNGVSNDMSMVMFYPRQYYERPYVELFEADDCTSHVYLHWGLLAWATGQADDDGDEASAVPGTKVGVSIPIPIGYGKGVSVGTIPLISYVKSITWNNAPADPQPWTVKLASDDKAQLWRTDLTLVAALKDDPKFATGLAIKIPPPPPSVAVAQKMPIQG